jgi:thymidylate kinase
VRSTRLVLFEGLPGSGKSSTAQAVERRLRDCGVPARWWYEEEKGHPVYIFHDAASLGQAVELFFSPEYPRAVEQALARWRAFARAAASEERVLLIDSCLLGYVTWTLHHVDAPMAEVERYLEALAEILAPLEPCLVLLRQDDVAASQERLARARGADWGEHAIDKAVASPYGRRLGLTGFDGMVRFWQDYRDRCDRLVDRLGMPMLRLDVSARDWPTYQTRVAALLDLPSPDDLTRYVGAYGPDGRVELEGDALVTSGVPELWQRCRLIRRQEATFEVESLPFRVSFEANRLGDVRRLRVEGRELMWRAVGGAYQRR